MPKHQPMVAPEAEEKEIVQLRMPGWVWRHTKAAASLRVPHMPPGQLVTEALVAYLGLKPQEAKQRAAS